MKTQFFRRFIAAGIFLSGIATSNAGQQSVDDIEASVERFLRDQSSSIGSVEIKPLDNRLRLAVCDVPVRHDWANGSGTVGRVTVATSCESPKPWRIHVQANVTHIQKVWITKRIARRGDVITKDMGEWTTVELGNKKNRVIQNDAPIDDINAVLGFEFVQNVDAGRVLTQRMLKPKALIAKGERVILRVSSSVLKLQTSAVAISGGALGDRIQVKNSSSGNIVDARVTDHGIAEALN